MKSLKAAVFVFLVFSGQSIVGQSGPAGVGTTATNPLWLKADVGTSSNTNLSPISLWSDQSGNSNDAVQATNALQPLYRTGIINGMPTLQFDNVTGANADQLVIGDNNNLDNTAVLSIFSISQPNSLDGSQARAILSKRQGADNNESYMIFYFTSDKVSLDIDGTNNRFSTATTFVNNNNYLIGMVYDGTQAAASRVRMYVNETFDSGGPRTESSASIPNYLSNLSIGLLNVNDGRPFGGHIAEIIIYLKAVNVAERLIVSNYLSAKYNIALLPASDLYAGDNSGNGDFDFEVAGVGNDASGNNTAAASSVTGGLAVAEAGGFGNGDYLLYGHAAGSNAVISTDVGGMTGTSNARWSRIWYLDATFAAAGRSVNLTFDGSDSGITLAPPTTIPSQYVLLYRSVNSGNWSELMTATSISGDRITFGGVVNAADGYYTIGTRDNIGSALPIQLVDFTAAQGEKGVTLAWKTATEVNNQSFTVERSSDGQAFTKLLDVPGAGNSIKELSYSATDVSPLNGISYYRLKQTDFNGAYTYSKIVSIYSTSIESSIKFYPNPASSTLHVELPANLGDVQMNIFNAKGQRIPFTFSSDGQVVTIDTTDFQKGLYLIQVANGRTVRTEKIVIQ